MVKLKFKKPSGETPEMNFYERTFYFLAGIAIAFFGGALIPGPHDFREFSIAELVPDFVAVAVILLVAGWCVLSAFTKR